MVSYFSWNYFGIIFIVYLLFFFEKLEASISSNSFSRYYFTILFYLSIWHFSALSWMLEIDNGIFGIIANLILYTIPFIIYYFFYIKLGASLLTLIPIWLGFEYLINELSFSYPWLTLGNLLANQVVLAQWYEYTGVLGGSFWILIITYFVHERRNFKNFFWIVFPLVVLPIALSFYLYKTTIIPKNSDSKKIIASYDAKFREKTMSEEELAFYFLKQKDDLVNTNIFLIPECTFKGMQASTLKSSLVYKYLNKLQVEAGLDNIVFGASLYSKNNKITNSGVILNRDTFKIKVKKRLVPLNEYLPSFMTDLVNRGSYRSDVKDDLKSITSKNRFMPVICYEVFYGSFVSKNIGDSEVIYVLSSEEFFKNSINGKRQYDNIIRLRAIENRVPIVKSSSFGYSISVDIVGNISKKESKELSFHEIRTSSYKPWYRENVSKLFSIIVLFLVSTIILHRNKNKT